MQLQSGRPGVADRTIGNGLSGMCTAGKGQVFRTIASFALSSLTPMQASWMLRVVDAAGLTLWEQHSQGCVELCKVSAAGGACMSEPGLLQWQQVCGVMGCPYCLNRKVCPCTSLSRAYPEGCSGMGCCEEWGAATRQCLSSVQHEGVVAVPKQH